MNQMTQTPETATSSVAVPTAPAPSAKRSPALRWVIITVLAVIAALVVAAGAFAAGLYKFGLQGRWVDRVVKIVPYPIATVNASFVPYREYLTDFSMLRYYYEKNPDLTGTNTPPTDAELQKIILNRLVYDAVLRQTANEFNVQVTQKELDDQLTAVVKQLGDGANMDAMLKQLYGLTKTQFAEKVLRPILVFNKLDTAVTNDPKSAAEQKKHAEEVLALVKEGKQDFAALAKQYSQDSTNVNGGDLGFFGKGTMEPEFETAAFALQPGQVSGIVQTKLGYHIIKIEERIADKGKGEQIHARQILFRTRTADDLLQERLANARIHILFRGFHWDAKQGWATQNGTPG